MVFILPIVIIATLYISWSGLGRDSLVSSQVGSAEMKDFIVHIRVEEIDDEIKVYRSLQYIGNETVEIEHQAPLISISLQNKNHDFTGSRVKKVMESGDSYYPQKAKLIGKPEEGEYTLYCLAEFQVDGEQRRIMHTEKLIFE